jgi:hypothetical protein
MLVLVLVIGTGGKQRASASHKAMARQGEPRSEVRDQKSEVRNQKAEAKEQGRRGAVRTSVTLLGQNIGNTMSIIVYTFCVHLQFYSGGYPPNKIARRQIHLAERQPTKPNLEQVARDWLETHRPTGQTGAEEEPVSF